MSILNVYPQNEEQEKALIIIFDAFGVKYDKEMDATEYLMSSEANVEALYRSIKQIEEGNVIKISLEDLWK